MSTPMSSQAQETKSTKSRSRLFHFTYFPQMTTAGDSKGAPPLAEVPPCAITPTSDMAEMGYNLEICPDTKRVHYQGYIYYRNARYVGAIIKQYTPTHIEAAYGNITQARLYTSKDNTKFPGSKPYRWQNPKEPVTSSHVPPDLPTESKVAKPSAHQKEHKRAWDVLVKEFHQQHPWLIRYYTGLNSDFDRKQAIWEHYFWGSPSNQCLLFAASPCTPEKPCGIRCLSQAELLEVQAQIWSSNLPSQDGSIPHAPPLTNV